MSEGVGNYIVRLREGCFETGLGKICDIFGDAGTVRTEIEAAGIVAFTATPDAFEQIARLDEVERAEEDVAKHNINLPPSPNVPQ